MKWVEAWLSDRKQRVLVCGEAVEWSSVTSGVTQGPVLGPVLFIIFVNDIDINIASSVLKFADDTKLVRRVATTEEDFTLQEDLHKCMDGVKTGRCCKVPHLRREKGRMITI